MILITDSNLIVSALISPQGTVAKVFKDKVRFQFLAPNYLFEEINIHWKKIVKLSDISEKELKKELLFYKQQITIYEIEEIKKSNLRKAQKIVKDIDPDDVLFVALHFQTKHKIWTGDKELIKGLKAKGYNIFVTTEELKNKLYKK